MTSNPMEQLNGLLRDTYSGNIAGTETEIRTV